MGEVDCRDLVRFLDIKIDPVTPTIPKSIHVSFFEIFLILFKFHSS